LKNLHTFWADKLRYAFILPLICTLFFTVSPAALAQSGWDISSFASDIIVGKDGSIDVTETIVADYTHEEHHGIIRYIPVRYRDNFGNKLSLQFDLLSITDETGKPWMYEQTFEDDNVYLKIGNPDIYLNRLSTFKIKYRVERAMLFLKEVDEIYWNATGTEWDAPIRKVQSTVTLPADVKDSDIKVKCYTGYYGIAEESCTSSVVDGKVTFDVKAPSAGTPALGAGQGLTIEIGWPKGIVAEPGFFQRALWFVRDNWGFFLPPLTFSILYYLWYTRGRDPQVSRSAIMPIYKPPNGLTPTEIGTIIDEKADLRDITSAIIDLAIRGFLKINETKVKKFFGESTDYEFEKLKDFETDATLKEYEKELLRAIFGNLSVKKLKDLENKFYSHIQGIKDEVYGQLVRDGYFPVNPEKVRSVYYTIGGVVFGIMLFGAGAWFTFFSPSVTLGIIISSIIILAFAGKMPAKTKKGVETFTLIKGLEEFINTAEKDRIKWQEKENIFEKLLPYAMTLGLADKWTGAFEGIYKKPPDWYGSSDPNFATHFSAYNLMHSIKIMNNSMQSTFVSAPRSSSGSSSWGGGHSSFGGGFSGGGFGGGGGSSW
jgi:uncharacterized membrane protein